MSCVWTVVVMRSLLIVGIALVGLVPAAWASGGPEPGVEQPLGQTRSQDMQPQGARFAAVFGDDHRVELPARYGNLRHVIGLLFNVRARMVCSAFCVGEDMIATAAHCLYKTRGETPPTLEEFQFSRFADNDRKPTRLAGHETRSTAQFVVAGNERLSIKPPIDATSDWAIARLSRPVCSQGHLTINPMTPDQIIAASGRGRLFHVAFHRDVPNWQLTYSTPCTAGREYPPNSWDTIAQDFARPEDLLLHTCDTGGASSGSPLLIDGASGPEVVGINVGTYVVSQHFVKDGAVVRRMRTENVANTAVAARSMAAQLEILKTAHILAPGHQMMVLQAHLKELGYYSGPLDGRHRADLKRAIEAFEVNVRLPVTGLATRALLKRLGDDAPALAANGAVETSPIVTSSLGSQQSARRKTARQPGLSATTRP